jgi:precorrin-6Y C5,15-methyltransferase (decarboxylating)
MHRGTRVGEPIVTVVGLLGGEPYGRAAVDALAAADVVLGSARQFDEVAGALAPDAERLELRGPLEALLDALAVRLADGRQVGVLASGDPGFFGIVRALGRRFGPERLVVHPAPSSIAMAFARLGLPWDDAAVVSAHGRPLADAVAAIDTARARAGDRPIAVLPSPDNPPEVIGRAVSEAGWPTATEVAVAAHLGTEREAVHRLDLAGLAVGSFPAMSVVVLLPVAAEPSAEAVLAWGRDEARFEHRDGMITKAETRAVALGKLAVPARGVLWDVGAGSGSVGVEAAALAPGLRVLAVERDPAQCARIAANAAAHGVAVEVHEGTAPAALTDLPDPDRVFVGGGGLDVLDVALGRLRPGGTVVATYAIVERAIEAHRRLGHLVQLNVSRGAPIGDLGTRLVPENPVFVCWGPGD